VKRAQGRVWRWDGLASEWRAVSEREVVPGMILWVAAEVGGYDPEIGFDPALKLRVAPLGGPDTPLEAVDADPDTQSSKVRISLARHSAHVRDEALRLAAAFKLADHERDLIVEAALWHDLGKAHPAFVARMGGRQPPLAKSPDFNPKPAGEIAQQRPYFRHELASALGYLANHGWSEEASLTAYLIAAHHGKVRLRLRALPREPPADGGRLFARGVWDGDLLPNTWLGEIEIPKTALDLDLMLLGDGRCGPSWSARTQHLLHRLGPFQLAWLEALVRIADWRASQMEEEAGHDDL
jgi:CRISPR-associated endonuclease/helicase Cas3